MISKRLLATVALIGLTATPVLAQITTPATPARPAVTAPAAPPAAALDRPSSPAVAVAPSATTPVGKKVNLNTATAEEIDALPQIGKARAKAIMDERTKGKFKDWADFDKRMDGTSVNAGAKTAIQDRVTF